MCFGAHFLHLVISPANGRLRVLIIHLSHLKTATELLLKCILVHFFAFYRSLFFPPSFNECCFALCSTSRLQFGIWESWLDSKTVVTQRLLLIKPRQRAEWVQTGWVLGGGCCAWRVDVVVVVFVDVLVVEVCKEMRKWKRFKVFINLTFLLHCPSVCIHTLSFCIDITLGLDNH